MKRTNFIILVLLSTRLAGWAAEPAKSRDSYVQTVQTELQALTNQVDALQKRSEKAGAQTRVELEQRVMMLKQKLDVARQKLSDAEKSSETTWNSFQKSVDNALHDAQRAYRRTLSFFNKSEHKGEP
jgi:seryl-tRNA synthetase